MKKYAQPTLFFLVIFGFSFFLSGCGVRRDVARVSVVESTVERVEETIDTSRIYIETETHQQIQEEIQDNTFIRTTEFDETGTVVLRVREEFRNVQQTHVSVLSGQTHYVSVADVITTTIEHEEIQALKTEEISFDADARTLGRMWAVSVVAAVVFLLIVLYMRKQWRR